MLEKVIRVLKIKSRIIQQNLTEGIDYAFNHKQKRQILLAEANEFLSIRNDKLPLIDNVLSCDVIIFSKDRAIQLHALLDSYFKLVDNTIKPFILFTCSSEAHRKSYLDLEKIYGNKVSFVYETNFRNQLIQLVGSLESEKLFFMTDDGVFIDKLDLNEFIKFNPLKVIANFARGKNCNYCYTYNSEQKIPDNIILSGIDENKYITWIWKNELDSPGFSYPLSLDGALFNRLEILSIFKNLEFKAPNTLEGVMQIYLPFFECRIGLAFENVKYVNVPINLVQTETKNINTGLMSVDYLLEQWNLSHEIDYDIYQFMDYKIIQLSPYKFRKR